ncbi:dihydrodipicolinate synthase family protein [Aquibaculum arenosum]|uniref:Dihydrodipicolinate synthase family protein n=1 Tax=Aquibaculum arenosum TaxID=3032591 RepID=A0ABT5YJF1_9PROT|nr:dihydrodipicolinate synthase family protein [Fodinicurvata sp. CAU 1616]MDF2094389.1 dihydrodipicolinate synthase family protein [Fodinicurvata sp. CAU 1616]
MKTSPVEVADLQRSVISVPPLARRSDLSLDAAANQALIRYLEAGDVTTLMYGGNANFYHIGLQQYAEALGMLAESAGAQSWVIPSAGPEFGRLQDQVAVLREHSDFPTVMVLPLTFPATPDGVATGVRHFAEAYGKKIILYVKNEGYLTPELVGSLVDDGLVCAIKYAVVREDPREDALLRAILERVDASIVISGIGERPAIDHFRHFGLRAFTSGSVCVAPRSSTALRKALQRGDYEQAESIRQRFLPIEDLRDGISPIRILHDAVTLGGIADMGPMLPMLSNLSEAERAKVQPVARDLASLDASMADAA